MFSVGRIAQGISRRASPAAAISRRAAPALAPLPGLNSSSRCTNPHPATPTAFTVATSPTTSFSASTQMPILTASQLWLLQQVNEVGNEHGSALQQLKGDRMVIMDRLYVAVSTSSDCYIQGVKDTGVTTWRIMVVVGTFAFAVLTGFHMISTAGGAGKMAN